MTVVTITRRAHEIEREKLSYNNLAFILIAQGKLDAAAEAAWTHLNLCEQQQLPVGTAMAQELLAYIELVRGNTDAAACHLCNRRSRWPPTF